MEERNYLDDDLDIILPYLFNFPPRRLYTIRDRLNPLEVYDERDFIIRYRMGKSLFLDIFEQIKDNIVVTKKSGKEQRILLPITQFSIAVRFYATGSFQVRKVYFYPYA